MTSTRHIVRPQEQGSPSRYEDEPSHPNAGDLVRERPSPDGEENCVSWGDEVLQVP